MSEGSKMIEENFYEKNLGVRNERSESPEVKESWRLSDHKDQKLYAFYQGS